MAAGQVSLQPCIGIGDKPAWNLDEDYFGAGGAGVVEETGDAERLEPGRDVLEGAELVGVEGECR